jgi:hypothetical protein
MGSRLQPCIPSRGVSWREEASAEFLPALRAHLILYLLETFRPRPPSRLAHLSVLTSTPSFCARREQRLVQQLVEKPAVEAPDKGILDRLTGRDVLDSIH